jgi:hypothetical protein
MRSMNAFGPIPIFFLAIVFSMACGACSGGGGWAGSVAERDGTEILMNPAVPLMAGAEPAAIELWSYQGTAWMNPSLVHVQGDVVTVVDPPANQIHRVSTEGEEEESLGRPGGGPGEFLRLRDALPDGERFAVLDAGKSGIQYLDQDGRFVSSLYLEGQPWGGFFLGDGTLLVKGEFLSNPTEETRGDWVILTEGRDPRAFTTVPLNPLPEEEGVQCSELSSWQDGAARMRYTTPQIQLFDAAGHLRKEIQVGIPIEPVSEKERSEALADLEESLVGRGLPPPFVQQNLVVMQERWRVKCRFGPLRFDSSARLGAFLEENPDEFGGGNATLHLLSRDGVYLAKIVFPDPWRDFAMDNGIVYALTRDSVTDVITLRAYRVDLPQAVLSQASRVLEEAREHVTNLGH